MSELKAVYATDKNSVTSLYYPKSEVDAVITEFKAQVNGLHNRANLWHYNAQNEHNAAVAVHMENAKLKAKLAEKDQEIAKLKEQYKDMDVTHTVHIAKMNALIEELEEAQHWRKFSEEKPELGEVVLVKFTERAKGHYYPIDVVRWDSTYELGEIEVSHWMPRPKEPEDT